MTDPIKLYPDCSYFKDNEPAPHNFNCTECHRFDICMKSLVTSREDKLNMFPYLPDAFIDSIIEYRGEKMQDVLMMEECAELSSACTTMIQTMSKSLRGKDNKASIIEEMAHVLIQMRACMRTHEIRDEEILNEIVKKIWTKH